MTSIKFFVLAAAFLSFALISGAENLVQNPGFETGEPEPWVSFEGLFGEMVNIVEGEGRSGDYALKIEGDPEHERNRNVIITQRLPITPSVNDVYRVVAYVKTNVTYARAPDDGPGPRSAGVQVRQLRGGSTVVYSRFDTIDDEDLLDDRTREWGGRKHELIFIPHPDADGLQLYLRARNLRSGDYIIFDDFKFEVLDEEDERRYRAFE